MSLSIEWKPEFLVGDAFIDGQHQFMFELANALLASQDRLQTNKLLMQLFKYTREHFSAEEGLMRKRGYLAVEAHCEEHNKMIEALSNVVAHSSLDDLAFHKEVYHLMKGWILTHILDYDMRIPKE